MSILAQALLEFPQMAPLLVQQVKCLLKLGHADVARELINSCVDLVPESTEVWIIFAKVCLAQKDYL
jgi:predicted Zn-dependent protease